MKLDRVNTINTAYCVVKENFMIEGFEQVDDFKWKAEWRGAYHLQLIHFTISQEVNKKFIGHLTNDMGYEFDSTLPVDTFCKCVELLLITARNYLEKDLKHLTMLAN